MSEEKQEKLKQEETVSVMQKRLEAMSGEIPQDKEKADEGSPARKYESDLTRKEKRLLEKQKIKGMGMGKKLEYIWMYYKPVIFGVILAIALVFMGKEWYDNAQIVDILSISVVNGGMGETESWAEEIKRFLGSTDPNENVVIAQNLTADEGGAEFDYYSQMAFVAQVQAHSVDILITTEDMCRKLSEEEFLEDLSVLLDEDVLAAFGDKATEHYVRLEGSELEEYIALPYSPVCIAVMGGAANMDNAVAWLESLAK